MDRLRVGVARRDITPAKGEHLIGYGGRFLPNIGAREPLTVTALALQQGETRTALVSCDVLAVSDDTVRRVEDALGYRVVINAIHTHAGPVTHADETTKRRAYHRAAERLIRAIVDAVRTAEASAESVTLHHAQTEAYIGVNRRQRNPDGKITVGYNPTGSIDRSLHLLEWRKDNGDPLAHVVNFACHPTSLGPHNRQAAADWVGVMRQLVESQTDVPLLFIQGACADINPRTIHNTRTQWTDRFNLGHEVFEAIMAAMPTLQPIQHLPLQHDFQLIELPIDAAPDPVQAQYETLRQFLPVPKAVIQPVLAYMFPWRITRKATPNGDVVIMRADALRVGDVLLVGMAAEVFTEIGMTVKNNAPAPITLFGGVTNGCISYLPTTSEHALGGYEVDVAPHFFNVGGTFKANAEAVAVEGATALMQKLYDD